ncbi:MAG: tetratricopeptide repeat protein [Cryomorphaceae bacterium]|nr:tetratricopeptide repeat protein [Cryomorphaceae bacterium]
MIKNNLVLLSLITIVGIFSSCESKDKGSEASSTGQKSNANTTTETSPLAEKIDSLSLVIAEEPKNIDALIARGNAYIDNKNPAYARADADAAFFLDSTRKDVLLLRGDVNYVLNQTRRSRDMWEKCSALFPKDTECRLRIAELYMAIKDLDNALKFLNEVLDIDERNANALFMKGVVIRDRNQDTTLALQYIQRAIDVRDGNYIEALDMMGTILSWKNDPMAIQYFKNAIALNPNRDDLYLKLGLSYANIEEYNAALEAYEKALQLNPRNDEVHFNIGFINISLQNYDLAIDNFNKAIDLKEMNVRAIYGRAFAYEMRGDVMNAAKDYQTCLGMFPDYEPARIGLERIQRMTKDDNIELP